MIKSISGINMCGDRIRNIDKCNTTAVCPEFFENETWDRVVACSKNKENREEWEKDLGKKIE